MKLIIYYNVESGGDGSVHANFFESEELAEWDDEHDIEGWAEPSVGSIIFESDSPISCTKDIITKELYLIEHYFDGYNEDNKEEKEFSNKFFPNGLPKFTVKTEEVEDKSDDYEYIYNNVYIGDKKITRIFKRKINSGKIFEDFLNKNMTL